MALEEKDLVAVWKNEDGNVVITVASPEILSTRSFKEVLERDLPSYTKFKILERSEIPWEYPQEAWEVDPKELDSGVASEYNFFPNERDAYESSLAAQSNTTS